MERRGFLAGLTATAAALPLPAQANAPVMKLRPLPPLPRASLTRLLKAIEGHEEATAAEWMPEAARVMFQFTFGWRRCRIAFPHPDALDRLREIADEWPRMKPYVELCIEARLRGDTDIPHPDFSIVRIDTGPNDPVWDEYRRALIRRHLPAELYP